MQLSRLFALLTGCRQGIYSEIQRAELSTRLYSDSLERKGNKGTNQRHAVGMALICMDEPQFHSHY